MNVKLFYDNREKSTKVQLTEQIFVGKFYIPRGFISDGGSIPRIFWRLFSPLDSRYLKYYIQHDFIYATGIRERKESDILLRNGLKKARYEFYRQMGSLFFSSCFWLVTLQKFFLVKL